MNGQTIYERVQSSGFCIGMQARDEPTSLSHMTYDPVAHFSYAVEDHRVLLCYEWLILVTRVRLFVDGFSVDERYAVWGEVRLHGEFRDRDSVRPLTVEVGIGFLGGTNRCVVVEDGVEYPLVEARERLTAPVSKDCELLEAMRDNGGRATPVEAAMATSLSVSEADELLTELAGGGHLMVEREGGALVYALPGDSGGRGIEAS